MSRVDSRGPVVAVLLGVVVVLVFSFTVQTLHASRDRSAAISVFATHGTTVDRFVQETLLADMGEPADPGSILTGLRMTVTAFLDGGEVTALQGSEHNQIRVSAVDDAVRPILLELWGLANELESAGAQLGSSSADRSATIQEMRTKAALVRSLASDAVGALTANEERRLGRQLALVVGLGVLMLATGAGALARERRVGRQIEAERFAAIVRESDDWIMIVDQSLEVSFSTPASRDFVGLDATEVRGRSLVEFVAEGEGRLRALLRDGSGPAQGAVALNVRRDGSFRRTLFSVTDQRHAPSVGGWVLIGRDDHEAQELRDQLVASRHVDALTGLANRADSVRELTVRLARMGSGGMRPIIVVLDIDQFHEINRQQGQGIADGVLRRVAAALEAWAPPSSHIARTGDDEFVLLIDSREAATPALLAEQLHRRITGTVRVSDRVVQLRVSVVARRAARDERDAGMVLQDALAGVRAIKGNGGNAASEVTTIELLTDE